MKFTANLKSVYQHPFNPTPIPSPKGRGASHRFCQNAPLPFGEGGDGGGVHQPQNRSKCCNKALLLAIGFLLFILCPASDGCLYEVVHDW